MTKILEHFMPHICLSVLVICINAFQNRQTVNLNLPFDKSTSHCTFKNYLNLQTHCSICKVLYVKLFIKTILRTLHFQFFFLIYIQMCIIIMYRHQKFLECLLRIHKIEKCAKDGLTGKDTATCALNFYDKSIIETVAWWLLKKTFPDISCLSVMSQAITFDVQNKVCKPMLQSGCYSKHIATSSVQEVLQSYMITLKVTVES